MAGDSPDGPSAPSILQTPKPPPSVFANAIAKIPPVWVNPLCGSLAGVASGIVTCPLDVIKTKLQAQGSFRPQQTTINQPSTAAVYRGLVGTARTIIQQDGLKGMYRGLSPMLFGYIPTWAVYMGVYDTSKNVYLDYFSKSSSFSVLPLAARLAFPFAPSVLHCVLYTHPLYHPIPSRPPPRQSLP